MSSPTESNSSRIAAIARHNGQEIGVCIFLSAAQLRDLDIDPSRADAVAYDLVRINGGRAVSIQEVADSQLSDTPTSSSD